MINWDDFEKIDIRSGTIIEVNDFPKAKKQEKKDKIGEIQINVVSLDDKCRIWQRCRNIHSTN